MGRWQDFGRGRRARHFTHGEIKGIRTAIEKAARNIKKEPMKTTIKDRFVDGNYVDEMIVEISGVKGWASESGARYKSVPIVEPTLPSALYGFVSNDHGHFYEKVAFNSDEAIHLPGLPIDYILGRIRTFWAKADEYKKYGLVHKTGIMLYGSPGCGKTTIAKLLCLELFKIGGVAFKIDSFIKASSFVSEFRDVEPDRPILTIQEDIEGIFEGMHGADEVKAALSFLDGQDQANNIVHVACPSPETRILTADLEWVRADSLVPGDRLVAFDEEPPKPKSAAGRKLRTAVVKSCPIISKRRYCVTTDRGQQIASENHPFLIGRSGRRVWRFIEDLKIGDKICFVCDPWRQDNSYTSGYIAAQYDGEGSLMMSSNLGQNGSKSFSLRWAQADGPVFEKMWQSLINLGFNPSEHKRGIMKGLGGMGLKKDGTPHKKQRGISILGGRWEQMRLIGVARPVRFLSDPKLKTAWENVRVEVNYAIVNKVEYVGEGPVVALDTTTKTFIGEGMLQHNTSNMPEKIADRFIKRPGRFDLVIGVKEPIAITREAYFRNAFKTPIEEKILQELVHKTEGLGLAYLREIVASYLCLGIPIDETLGRLKANAKTRTFKNSKEGYHIGYVPMKSDVDAIPEAINSSQA